jgi:hypothetical protein
MTAVQLDGSSQRAMAGTITCHMPGRPSWTCQVCGLEWPCPIAREELSRQHAADPVELSVFMSEQLYDAARDLFRRPPAELWARFIAWTGPVPEPIRSATTMAAELRRGADRRR